MKNTRPLTPDPASSRDPLARSRAPHPQGLLHWRALLDGLAEDGALGSAEHQRLLQRFSAGDSHQHPLVRIASVNLNAKGTTRPLDVEALTEWLAGRVGLPYLRIDPLRVDVGRVAEIMSITYAERRRALPLTVGLNDVTIATCEPLDVGWVPEIEAHARKAVKLVVVSPLELARYTTEFYTLSRSVRAARTPPLAAIADL